LEIECGILGQRFDAVFHIETRDGGDIGGWCGRLVGEENHWYGDSGEDNGDDEVLDVIICNTISIQHTCFRDLIV
jgi:hypothetical protein